MENYEEIIKDLNNQIATLKDVCEEEHRAAQCMQRKLEKIKEWAKTADIDLASEVKLNEILEI